MSVSRSLVYSLLTSVVSFVSLLLSSMVVSRILTPAEMGLFTVSMGVITILITLRVFGLAPYLIQARELDDHKIRTVLGLSIGISWALGLAVLGLARPAAGFYGSGGVAPIFFVLAVEFLLFPFRIVPVTLLQRRMAFGRVFVIEGASSILGASLTVIMVVMEFGVISLAAGRVAGALTALILTMAVAWRDCYFRPRFSLNREILGFSSIVAVSNLVASLRTSIAPLFTERTVVRLDEAAIDQRLSHWRKVTIAACEQCGRRRLPSIERPVNYASWIETWEGPGVLMDPGADKSLADLAPPSGRFALLVGPEGGLASDERTLAVSRGLQAVRLGPRVHLRTRTCPRRHRRL